MMTGLPVRQCPQCGSERPAAEVVCENDWNDSQCLWSLADVPLVAAGYRAPLVGDSSAGLNREVAACPNGHPLAAGDVLCFACGETAISISTDDRDVAAGAATYPTTIA